MGTNKGRHKKKRKKQVNNKNKIVNSVTGCMDASMVYSSLDSRTESLCKNAYPYLKMDKDGCCTEDICPVSMGNPLNFPKYELFAFGDTRGNENPGLQSIHIMWAYRHNQWVDYYKKTSKKMTKGRLFEKARARIIAEMQHVSKLYLGGLIGYVPKYVQGKNHLYDGVKIFAEFSHGINRIQHAQLHGDMELRDAKTNKLLDTKSLMQLYFNIKWIREHGAGDVINGMLHRKCLSVELAMSKELNGNFGPHGPNLALLDCERGREAGFDNYKYIRKLLFGERVNSLDDVTSNKANKKILKKVYGKDGIGNVDLYVGGLAETHAKGAQVGKTFRAIFEAQLNQLMYGDKNWYENKHTKSPLSKKEIEEIKKLSIADILLESTNIKCVPKDALHVQSKRNKLVCKKHHKSVLRRYKGNY